MQLRDRIKALLPIGVVAGIGTGTSRVPCEFHGSTDPDLQIFHGDGSFRCWSPICPAHKPGDIFTWVMLRDGLDFQGALKVLAREAKINLETASDRIEILSRATQIFHDALFAPSGARALRYLVESRKFSEETLRIHRIGLCDRFPTGLTMAEAQEVGLVHKNFLLLQDRITLPVFDLKSQIVHMQGRAYRGSQSPKYLALPRTPSDALDRSQYAITEHLFNERALSRASGTLFLFEGVPDCLTADQWGLPAVAIFGNRDLHKHAYKFRNLRKLIVCLDADAPSRAVVLRELSFLQAKIPELAIYEMSLPEDKDLNDFLVRGGTRAQFLALADERARPFIECLLDDWSAKPHLHQPLIQTIAALDNATEYIDYLAYKCDTTTEAIRFAMRLTRNTQPLGETRGYSVA